MFKCCKKLSSLSSPSVQIKKMSAIYLNHNHDFISSISRNSLSTLSIKIHVKGGANLVPIAVLEICFLILESNSK